ncbi:MAG TPA: hypothetical protein VF338_02880, partial [Leptolinea sp.]
MTVIPRQPVIEATCRLNTDTIEGMKTTEYRLESPIGPRVVINGREVDYFSGTGYLGLQSHPAVLQAAIEALLQYGISTATSRGGFGEHPIYHQLEKEACAYFAA